MAQSQRNCYLALIILQDYSQIDNKNYDLSRVKSRVVDEKVMPLQVECIIVLSNGDIAISGGAFRFEIMIYRHDLDNQSVGVGGRQREQLKLVDTIDTNGMTVVQMLELNDQYLLVIGHMCNMQVFKRVSAESLDSDSSSSTSSESTAPNFNLSVDFTGLLSKATSTTKPYQP